MLLPEHGIYPSLLVRGDDFYYPFQVGAGETLVGKNLADFLPLPFWECSNVKLFLPPGALSLLLLGASAQEVAYSHAEPIGHQVGYPQDDDHRCGKVGPGYSGYYGKVSNRAVNSAEDKVTEVARLWPAGLSLSGMASGVWAA